MRADKDKGSQFESFMVEVQAPLAGGRRGGGERAIGVEATGGGENGHGQQMVALEGGRDGGSPWQASGRQKAGAGILARRGGGGKGDGGWRL